MCCNVLWVLINDVKTPWSELWRLESRPVSIWLSYQTSNLINQPMIRKFKLSHLNVQGRASQANQLWNQIGIYPAEALVKTWRRKFKWDCNRYWWKTVTHSMTPFVTLINAHYHKIFDWKIFQQQRNGIECVTTCVIFCMGLLYSAGFKLFCNVRPWFCDLLASNNKNY